MAANDVNIRIKAIDETRRAFDTVKSSLGSLKSAVFSVQGVLAGLAGGAVVKNIIDTNVEFQKLEASLTTFTGSAESAKKEFEALSEFASQTPFQLEEVVGAFNILVARGMKPTEDALRSFGNIASGTGKTMNQFIEAVADAVTGEFERLKEFGIKASKEGDKIKFTFGGVTTEVKNNSEAIQGYLQSLGKTKFAGGMERQSKTLGGAFSNLADQISISAKLIGESGLNDFIVDITTSITDMVRTVNDLVKKKGIFEGIKEYLFGSKEENALKDAIQRFQDIRTTLADELAVAPALQNKNVIQQLKNELDPAIANMQAAAAVYYGTLSEVVVTANKIGSTLADTPKQALDPWTEASDGMKLYVSQMTDIERQHRTGMATTLALAAANKENAKATTDAYVAARNLRQNVGIGEMSAILQVIENSKTPLEQYVEKINDVSGALMDVKMNAIKSIEDGFVGLIMGTKSVSQAFKDMATSVIADLARMWVQKAITAPIAGMLGLTGKAIGGSVQAGKPYMVGERGPELFVPNQSGSIVPNGSSNGSGVTVVQNINVTTGVQQTVRAEVMSLMPQIAGAAKAAVADAKMRGGGFAAAMR